MATLPVPVLGELQQTMVWDGLIGAETRAQYFAALVQKFRMRQRLLTLGSLVLSSGAALSLLTTAVPARYDWVKPLLAVTAAVLSFLSLVLSNEKSATEASDLHYRWQSLAMAYEDLWADMYSDAAPQKLDELRKREADVSKSSTSMPNIVSLMLKAEANVAMHHGSQLAA